MITIEQLSQIMPHARSKVPLYADALNEAMDEFEINTPQRQAAFLAQMAHESCEFRYVEELASGSAYEGRADLGNNVPGDGVHYKGRGLIQITGRANYAACSIALFGYQTRLLNAPELLEQPGYACRSAAWFWTAGAGLRLSKRALAHGLELGCNLNDVADRGDFEGVTLAVNGGTNGYPDRLAYYERAQQVLA
jgi:putative chitinase